MNYLAQRQQELVRVLKKDGLDAFLVTHPVNVTYLTGFTGDSSYVVVSPKATVLVTDARFEEQLTDDCPGQEAHVRPHDQTIAEAAGEVLTKAGAKSVGIEADHVTLAGFEALKEAAPKCTFAAFPGRVEAMRAIKDPSEVEKIRAAIRAAERAFVMFKALLRETDTEKELSDAMEGYIRRTGAFGSSFRPICAIGERGALPHAPPTDRVLGESSKILVDWGADLGYKSDLTRTFRSPFGTSPSRRNKTERIGQNFDEIFDAVNAAHEAAVETIRGGVPAKDVDAAARKVLDKAGYGKYFTHGLGHGLGLEVHEAPRVRANSNDVLEAGMVITIEPGVYIPGWGGVRLEDDYLVTKEGAIRLTTLPREPGAIG